MIKKTVLAAATIAISMAAYQPAAQAGDFKLGIYLGDGYTGAHFGNGHWGDEHWGGPYKLTCHEGKRKLRDNGYRRIRANDCAGKYYNYRVVRGGKIFQIRMNAYTGRYRKTFLGWA